MWFLDQLEPGLTAYNVPGAVYLDGHLDVKALEAALREILRRHEILRTTYGSRDGTAISDHQSARNRSIFTWKIYNIFRNTNETTRPCS